MLPSPARTPTMYFIGVTTGASSIMRVFPRWAEHLGIDATLTGIDLPLDDTAEHYRAVVQFIKDDPLSLGALVTTHKLNLYKAARDLFDRVGESTALLDEVSSISKRGPQLWGHAMDPLTSGLSLEAVVESWRDRGDLLLLGAGGSSLALTLWLHERQQAGADVPRRLFVTNRRPGRIEEMREIHERIGFAIDTTYVVAPSPEDNDAVLATVAPRSVVVNATGLGKDRPGSPLTDAAVFPHGGVAWDFNYRGDLVFLDQARSQATTADLTVEDGWFYFVHGWTRVISEVFHLDIPTSGPAFDELADIARLTTTKETTR
jgi:shikimate 5-dehydrogenase